MRKSPLHFQGKERPLKVETRFQSQVEVGAAKGNFEGIGSILPLFSKFISIVMQFHFLLNDVVDYMHS